MNKTNSKIAEQSKQKIVKALLRVMEQYDFKEITVTQITQEAKLSRKTFYRLFSSKDDVLDLFFNGISLECIGQIKLRKPTGYWEVVQLYFDFCENHKDTLNLLRKNSLLPRLFEISYLHSLKVFEYVRSKETMNTFAPLLPYMLAYSVGGMNTMLLKWIENDMEISSSELISKLKSGFMSVNI